MHKGICLEEKLRESNEAKELKKHQFALDKEIEAKYEMFIKLTEENKNLEIINKNLRNKLKDTTDSANNNLIVDYNSNTNHIEQKKVFLSDLPYQNSEVDDLKEKLNEVNLTSKAKDAYLRDMRRRYKAEVDKISKAVLDIKDLSANFDPMKDELANLEKEYEKAVHEQNQQKENLRNLEMESNENVYWKRKIEELITLIEKALLEKSTYENSISSLRNEILGTSQSLEKSKKEYQKSIEEIEINQNEYAMLRKDKYIIESKIKSYENHLQKYESVAKTVESEIVALKAKFKTSKILYSEIEDNLTKKLYFIRFSNSLVRCFFNIINTRRLQIEMIKNLDKSDKKSYDFMFKKLDDMQSKLEKDYKDYILLCGQSEIPNDS